MSQENEYYYCMKHKKVEPWDGCRSDNRLGPYPSKEKASHAMEKVDQRNEAWENDPNWNDGK